MCSNIGAYIVSQEAVDAFNRRLTAATKFELADSAQVESLEANAPSIIWCTNR